VDFNVISMFCFQKEEKKLTGKKGQHHVEPVLQQYVDTQCPGSTLMTCANEVK